MAQVPYTPFPTAQPTPRGTPGLRIDTPIEAFGGGVANAIGSVGRAVEGAGNEMFARAMALQQLNNETEAKEADSQYMLEAGRLHADYSALQGKDRVDAFPKYAKDLNETRQRIRRGLSNDMARRMYDSSSLSTMGRSIFNGAGQAAVANKEYAINTAKAQTDIDLKTIEDDPSDSNFQQKLRRLDDNARQIATLQGMGTDSPMEKDLRLKTQSKAWLSRITGTANKEPFKAATMLDENKTQMTAEDQLRAENFVRTKSHAVESVNIADRIYQSGKETADAPAKSLSDMEAEAEREAKKADPNDPILAMKTIDALRHKYYFNRQAEKEAQVSNQQIVYRAIQSGVQNEQELLADPKVQSAYNALPPSDPLRKKPLNYTINAYNTERDKQEMERNYINLLGLARNDTAGFLNTNLNAMKLTPGNLNSLLAIRDKMIQKVSDDPRVWSAMRQLRGSHGAELQALGLYKRDPNNPEDYDKFTGALEIALDDYLQKNKKPADAKVISEQIFPEITRNISEEGRLWGTNKIPFYQMHSYTKEYEDFAKAYKANRADQGQEVSDEATFRAYMRFQYQRLHGSSSGRTE